MLDIILYECKYVIFEILSCYKIKNNIDLLNKLLKDYNINACPICIIDKLNNINMDIINKLYENEIKTLINELDLIPQFKDIDNIIIFKEDINNISKRDIFAIYQAIKDLDCIPKIYDICDFTYIKYNNDIIAYITIDSD